jgi:hypothetical protein
VSQKSISLAGRLSGLANHPAAAETRLLLLLLRVGCRISQ